LFGIWQAGVLLAHDRGITKSFEELCPFILETAIESQRRRPEVTFGILKGLRFVTGHDFSRAANA
jgi:hypothetical protein